MKPNILTSITLAGVLVAGCSSEQAPSSGAEASLASPGQVSIEQVVKDGFLKFKEKYGCPVNVEIVTGPITNDANPDIQDQVEAGQEKLSLTAAIGESGKITINQDFKTIYPSVADQVNLPHIAAHESVHACSKPTAPLPTAISIPNQNLKLTGTVGLSFMTDIRTPDGKKFQLIPVAEEGAAEVIADDLAGINPLSETTMPGYFGMKQLTLTLMERGDVSVKELVQYQQNNDLIGFFKQVSGLENPTTDNYLELIDLYQQSEDTGQSVIG